VHATTEKNATKGENKYTWKLKKLSWKQSWTIFLKGGLQTVLHGIKNACTF
jgi:hypothetical protein